MSAMDLSLDAGDLGLSVLSFHVRQAMSEPFSVDLIAVSQDATIDLGAIAGRPATFRIEPERWPSAAWSGVVSEVSQLHAGASAAEHAAQGTLRESTYAIRIVPALWLLGQRSRSRIFQHRSVIEIARAVLGEWGVEAEVRVDAARHPRLEVRTQYGETDLAFLGRLLEQAGISYRASRAGGVVLDDAPEAGEARALGALTFFDRPNAAARIDFATNVRVTSAFLPSTCTVVDYDPRRGDKVEGSFGEGSGQQDLLRRYWSGAAVSEGEADGATPVADARGAARSREEVAAARAEAWLRGVRGRSYVAALETNATDLGPGSVFTVVGHPQLDARPDPRLLVVTSHLSGQRNAPIRCRVEAVPADVPYRPEPLTPWPEVRGVQSAIVTGPPGEEIHVDELGRVRVRFPWDLEPGAGDESSCWLRVGQGWAGPGYGQAAIPRVGDEVLVEFAEGCPDTPIVVGRVHNGKNRAPYDLPAHRSRSAWRTASSPGGGGRSEILLEDRKGEELVEIRAERDLRKVVSRDEVERTGKDRTIRVRGDLTVLSRRELRLKAGGELIIEGGRVKLNCREDG